jgi:hypothetical protein
MPVSQVETSSITTIRQWKSCTDVAVSPWRSMQLFCLTVSRSLLGGYFQFVGVYWLSHQVHPSVRTGISFYHNMYNRDAYLVYLINPTDSPFLSFDILTYGQYRNTMLRRQVQYCECLRAANPTGVGMSTAPRPSWSLLANGYRGSCHGRSRGHVTDESTEYSSSSTYVFIYLTWLRIRTILSL